MSYETPEQKKMLAELQEISVNCASNGIEYGKALTAFNLGYGRISNIPPKKITKTPRMKKIEENKDTRSILRMKAAILSNMTGEQARLAQQLPPEMLAKVADHQQIGEVFSIDQIVKILKK